MPPSTVSALYEAGFRIVEVPLNSPQPFDSIAAIRKALPADAIVGAGTVLHPSFVDDVKSAGGELIVMPHSDPEVVSAAKAQGLACAPGVATPNEAFIALKNGADVLKMFPAEQLGCQVVKAWRAVIAAEVPLVPVGGITPDNMGPFLSAGANGFGLGSALYKPGQSAAVTGIAREGVHQRFAHRSRGCEEMKRLAGKVALVTGAGRGIGAAIAHRVRARGRGGRAGRTGYRHRAANGGAHQAQTGARVLAVHTDVTQCASVQHAVSEAERAFGPLDVLVNNAGINVFCDPLTMTDDDWRRCFAVDLDGVWNGCRAVLPGMVERGAGSIVNIASTHSFKIIPGCFPYPVAKHGVIGLTRALGIEYAPRNVRVNAIAPGYIETQLTHDWWNEQADPAAAQQATLDLQPMKRIGRPEEVAMTAVFLASDEAPFINATCITVDGGRSALYHD